MPIDDNDFKDNLKRNIKVKQRTERIVGKSLGFYLQTSCVGSTSKLTKIRHYQN